MGTLVPGTVRIEPRMEFQPTPMRFIKSESEWIIRRLRGLPHFAGEVFGPRFMSRMIKLVASGPHLKDNAVKL